jgi:uncharacterized protein
MSLRSRFPRVVRAGEALKDLLKAADIDAGHGYNHACAVLSHAQLALMAGPSCDFSEEVELAALLHDADDDKFFESPDYDNARAILAAVEVPYTKMVISMIKLVSCRANGDSPGSKWWRLIPRHADRLEAVGLPGLKRAHVYTSHVDRGLIHEDTPRCTTTGELKNTATPQRFADYVANKVKSRSMLDHYYDKILHIGASLSVCGNAYIEHVARRRHDIDVAFCLAAGSQPMESAIQRIEQEYEFN